MISKMSSSSNTVETLIKIGTHPSDKRGLGYVNEKITPSTNKPTFVKASSKLNVGTLSNGKAMDATGGHIRPRCFEYIHKCKQANDVHDMSWLNGPRQSSMYGFKTRPKKTLEKHVEKIVVDDLHEKSSVMPYSTMHKKIDNVLFDLFENVSNRALLSKAHKYAVGGAGRQQAQLRCLSSVRARLLLAGARLTALGDEALMCV
ncbi:hypothetical protein Dsin_001725 [Dipteronia sinensis]|uniref:Uncharacterized protein n=1 Tax=Dipteronia sinensis TaxID=43782 RepID=A0AAE0B5Y2_9ROSI|nr:hypothetical protein Dsin_001725 [Dipteronia sinensis]